MQRAYRRRPLENQLSRNESKKARIRIRILSIFTIIALLMPLMILEYGATTNRLSATANQSDESASIAEMTVSSEPTDTESESKTESETGRTETGRTENGRTETENTETIQSENGGAELEIDSLTTPMQASGNKYELYRQTDNQWVFQSSRGTLEAAVNESKNAPDGSTTFYIFVKDNDTNMTHNLNPVITFPADMTYTISSRHPTQPQQDAVWTITTHAQQRHFNVSGSVTLDNIILDGNGTGGGVNVNQGGTLTMNSGSVIRNCVSSQVNGNRRMGGGVYVQNGTLTMNDGSLITENFANKDERDNHGYGGGVYLQSSIMTMSGGSISENTANAFPDGARDGAGGGVFLNDNSRLTMSGESSISDNIASTSYTLAGWSYISGGGVYVARRCAFEMNENASLSGNVAGANRRGNGGAVYITGNPNNVNDRGTFTMNSGTISGNYAGKASDSAGADDSSNGGGVHVCHSGRFIMNGGTINDNYAASGTGASGQGGGISIVDNNSRFEMRGGTISDNTASVSGTGNGGGVAVNSGIFSMQNNSKISGNIASENGTGNGGGVMVTRSTSSMQNNSKISGNTASKNGTGNGGGIALNSSTFTMQNNSKISENTAGENGTGNGGGIAVSNSIFTVQNDSIISGNSAPYGNGGGIYLASGGADIQGGTISGNSAPKGHGGGIYTYVWNHTTLTVRAAVNFGSHSGTSAPNTASMEVNLDDFAVTEQRYGSWYTTIESQYGPHYSTKNNHPVNNYDINVMVYFITEKHVDMFGRALVPEVEDIIVAVPHTEVRYWEEAQHVMYYERIGYKWDTAPSGNDFIFDLEVRELTTGNRILYFVYELDVPPMGVSQSSSGMLIIPLLLTAALIPVGFKIAGMIRRRADI